MARQRIILAVVQLAYLLGVEPHVVCFDDGPWQQCCGLALDYESDRFRAGGEAPVRHGFAFEAPGETRVHVSRLVVIEVFHEPYMVFQPAIYTQGASGPVRPGRANGLPHLCD
jgi:hypothetical protein